METNNDIKLAVLIDADNVSSAPIREMLEEIAKYGTPTFKRIYGDWTKPNLEHWKKVLLDNSITPIQQYSYSTGKNATDSAMIIDAMDILYTGRVEGFCIVSSDSDFTRLASRLREAGMKVFGLGEKKTPTPFISACNKFIYLEILKKPVVEEVRSKPQVQTRKETKAPKKVSVSVPAAATALSKIDQSTIQLITNSVLDLADESGWASLAEVGNLLLKKKPNFDPRNYGFTKLRPLVKSISNIEVDERVSGKANIRHVFVRVKQLG
ncbi:MAG: NYN domain-containing protein [Flavobacteriales bacterium]|nr:NYN domain-containing protein [Flavobacteriales bacterium]